MKDPNNAFPLIITGLVVTAAAANSARAADGVAALTIDDASGIMPGTWILSMLLASAITLVIYSLRKRKSTK